MIIEVDFDIRTHTPVYCDGEFIYTSYLNGEYERLGLYSISKGKFSMNDCIKFFRQYKIQRFDVCGSLLCALGEKEKKNYLIIYDLVSFSANIMRIDKYLDFFENYVLYVNNSASVTLIKTNFLNNSSSVIMFDLMSGTAKKYCFPSLIKYYNNLSYGIIYFFSNDMRDGVGDKIYTGYFEPQLSMPERVVVFEHNNFDGFIELFSCGNEQSVDIIAVDETDIYYNIIDVESSRNRKLSEERNCNLSKNFLGSLWLNNYCGCLFKYNFGARAVTKLPYDINRVFSDIPGKRAFFYESSNIITDISSGEKICMNEDITDINNSFVHLSHLSNFDIYDTESDKIVSSFDIHSIVGNYMIMHSKGKS